MTKGKVVLVPFPFDDLSATKVRPAVCLTNLIGPYRHIILAFITSRIPAALLDIDLVLDASHAEFASTGLQVSSMLQLHRLMTTTTSLIRHCPQQCEPMRLIGNAGCLGYEGLRATAPGAQPSGSFYGLGGKASWLWRGYSSSSAA